MLADVVRSTVGAADPPIDAIEEEQAVTSACEAPSAAGDTASPSPSPLVAAPGLAQSATVGVAPAGGAPAAAAGVVSSPLESEDRSSASEEVAVAVGERVRTAFGDTGTVRSVTRA